VWVNTFHMCENDFSVEAVTVRGRVGKHLVGDVVLVVAFELGSASRALLLVPHDRNFTGLLRAPMSTRPDLVVPKRQLCVAEVPRYCFCDHGRGGGRERDH
jgi:hypothetical protein